MRMESNHQLSSYKGQPSGPLGTLIDMTSTHENLHEKGTSYLSIGNAHLLSLRIKLLLFAAALVLIPGGIYGAITLSSSRSALARVIGQQLVEEARSCADRLTMTLRSERERLKSL